MIQLELLIRIKTKKWKKREQTFQNISGGSASKESACNARDRLQSLDWEDPLEKETATHSSILVWEIPWREEPDELQSMGLQKWDMT